MACTGNAYFLVGFVQCFQKKKKKKKEKLNVLTKCLKIFFKIDLNFFL